MRPPAPRRGEDAGVVPLADDLAHALAAKQGVDHLPGVLSLDGIEGPLVGHPAERAAADRLALLGQFQVLARRTPARVRGRLVCHRHEHPGHEPAIVCGEVDPDPRRW